MSGFVYRGSTGETGTAIGEEVHLHYPIEDASSGRVDQQNAELVVGNQEIPRYDGDPGFQINFDQETNDIAVINSTEADWPPQTDIYVCVPSDTKNLDNMQKWQLEVEARLAALEAFAGITPAGGDEDEEDPGTTGTTHKAKKSKRK